MNLPVIQRSGNNITSDLAIKSTLFTKLKSAQEVSNSISVVERHLTASTSQTITATLNTMTNDYYYGGITSEGMSTVLQF
jgi:hypothetical protein